MSSDPTHDLVVVRQDNGELVEDVHPSAAPEEAELDEALAESFPASDPPSSWAGGGRGTSKPAEERVTHSQPLRPTADRPDPSEPVPGTLPRDQVGGVDPDRS